MTDYTVRRIRRAMRGRYLKTKTYVNSVLTNLFKGNMFLVDMLAVRNNLSDRVNAVCKLSYKGSVT